MTTDLDTITTNLIHAQQDLHRQQRQRTLARLADLMRSKGASEPTIQAALEGLHLLLQPSHAEETSSPSPSAIPGLDASIPHPEPVLPGRLLSTIDARPVEWLWRDHIPLGKLTLLEGISGIGTSLLTLTLAASLSSGSPVFGEPLAKQGTVILVAPNDNPAHILKPRLASLGADLSHILLLSTVERFDPRRKCLADRPFSLEHDLALLETTIERTHAPLVIIDPLSTVLHRVPASHQHDLFHHLACLAETTNCAILLVRHLTTVHSARNQDFGFPGLANSTGHILRLAPHPANQQKRLLMSTKYALTPSASPLALRLISSETGQPLFQPLQDEPPQPDSQYSHLSAERQAILHLLQASPEPLSPTFIALHTRQSPDAVRLLLSRMADADDITRVARGLYTVHSSRVDAALLQTPPQPANAPVSSSPQINPEHQSIDFLCPFIPLASEPTEPDAQHTPDTFDRLETFPKSAISPSSPLPSPIHPLTIPARPDTSDRSDTTLVSLPNPTPIHPLVQGTGDPGGRPGSGSLDNPTPTHPLVQGTGDPGGRPGDADNPQLFWQLPSHTAPTNRWLSAIIPPPMERDSTF